MKKRPTEKLTIAVAGFVYSPLLMMLLVTIVTVFDSAVR